MWEKIPTKNKRRYYFIVIVMLPVCFAISFLLSKKFFHLLDYQFDLKGWILISISLVPLYLISVAVVHLRLSDNKDKK
jgi:hypothetical protein